MGYFAAHLRIALGDGGISMAGHQRPEAGVYAGLVRTRGKRLLYWHCGKPAYIVDLVNEGWLLHIGTTAGAKSKRSS